MSNAIIQSVMARCLLEPDFLGLLSRNPSRALKGYSLDEQSRREIEHLDLERVGSFAGFIIKVQHNYLWEYFPCARALLDYYRAEIDVFQSYSAHYHGKDSDGQPDRKRKIKNFLNWLESHLQASGQTFKGVADVLTHERIIWELGNKVGGKRSPASQTDASSLKLAHFERLVPAARGAVRIGTFQYSPLKIVDSVSRNTFDPRRLRSKHQSLCYWIDPNTHQLRMFEVDDVAAALLSAVDGRHSIGSIIQARRLRETTRISRSDFREYFVSMEKQGVLRLMPSSVPTERK